jgi:hypothetical protein
MELRAPPDPEVSVARLLRGALMELQEAERLLVGLETETPYPERAAQLVIVRDAIVRLSKFVTLPPM